MARTTSPSRRRGTIAVTATLALALLAGCSGRGPRRDLRELVVQDSTYFAPETMLPYTGRVFRNFLDDSTRVEIEGAMLGGDWHGAFSVYHRSGRTRYAGSFDRGERCGPWTENSFDREPEDAYEALLSEIGTLALYPPCPKR